MFEWIPGQTARSLAGDDEALLRLGAQLGESIARLHAPSLGSFGSRLDGSVPSFDRWMDYVSYRID